MSRKKPNTLRSLGREEAAQVNQNFDVLYRTRLESLYSHDPIASATVIAPFQVAEMGRFYISATGSPTITKSFPIISKISDIVFAEANCQRVGTLATVTDVTASSITIETQIISSTGSFSAITTACQIVNWKVIGSTP